MSLRRALLLSTGERYFGMVVNFASIAVVSRTLTAAEVGLMAFGVALTGLVETLRDMGATSFVIQSNVAERDLPRTAFTVMSILTLAFVIPLLIFATPLARHYGDMRLAPLLTILALSYLPGPLVAIPFAMMRREMSFMIPSVIGTLGTTISSLGTIILALMGYGHLSYAIAMLITMIAITVLTVYIRVDLAWVFRPTLGRLRDILSFGGYSAISSLLLALFEFLPNLYLGRILGLDALGRYNRAWVMSSLPDKLLLTGLSPVVLPAFSALQRDGQSLKHAYLRGLEYLSAVKMPVHILLAILAPPAVRVLLGAAWMDVVPLIQIMSLAAVVTFPHIFTWPVMVAANAMPLYMRGLLIGWPLAVLAMYVGANVGLKALAYGWSIATFAFLVTGLYYVKQALAFTWHEAWTAVRKSVAVTAISMTLPTLAYGLLDPISIPLSIAVCVVAMASWLFAIYITQHPLMGELQRALDAARRNSHLRQLATRFPPSVKSLISLSTNRGAS
jgi:O-antigen/teichoic acid export membrane protein